MKSMTTADPIDAQLLDEMRIGPRSPLQLECILGRDGLSGGVDDVLDRLERLQDSGLVHGPGISRLHHLGVELTQPGRARLRELAVPGTYFGCWVLMT